jgi:hypothetical protein
VENIWRGRPDAGMTDTAREETPSAGGGREAYATEALIDLDASARNLSAR